ncbi:hypothetical protein TIFTF001_024580 [Ficus carica]|uniref:F-box protein n=1 Tax=Ficus carica TaxID=3494 RepID=A0AA88ALL7_FICCA|nr:hypothetical protein TIFTF001_024580 [Ficus carica]
MAMTSSSSSSCSSPPWEVLVLVSQYLDLKTLAMASCVCKSWSVSMSSDHLWRPIFTSHFPSLSSILSLSSSVSFHRLFAVAHTAAVRRRHTPSEPDLSLSDLIFTLTITTGSDTIVSLAKPADELSPDPNGVFKFDVSVDGELGLSAAAAAEEVKVKVAWNVVLKGWRAVFAMMDCDGKMRFAPGDEGWFSAELPPPGCCVGAAGSGIVADLKMGFGGRWESGVAGGGGGGGKVRVEKVSVGILSVVNWRYVTVEDGLRYLQHFLLLI